eukprot:g42866.t1
MTLRHGANYRTSAHNESQPTDIWPIVFMPALCDSNSHLSERQQELQMLGSERFTCTSVNLVYCTRCSQCGLLDISETKRRLRDRFVEHLRSVRDKRQHLQVVNHFNSPSNSLGDMSILGLLQCHNDTT